MDSGIKKTSPISPATLRLLQQAKDAGVPPDSLKRFLTAGYIPQPKQLLFHAAARSCDDPKGPEEIGFGGARGGAKTHATFAQVALDDCQRIRGLKVLFLRKVSKSANEAIEDLRSSVLFKTPHRFREQKSTIVFPNRSRIIIGHFQHEKDIDNYLGLEYDIIVIEEATQLSQAKIDKIKTCNRTAKPGFRPRRYYTTNPGGIGHAWFKRTFILPYRKGRAAERKNKTQFIPSTVKDNKKLNPEYIAVLEGLTGWLREAWLNGSWDIFAGQYFETFNYDDHVIKPSGVPSLQIPDLDIWCALDYGYNHYTVCYLLCQYDGITYIVDEFAARRQLVSSNTVGILEMLERNGVNRDMLLTFVAGTDVFARRGDSGDSVADEFSRCGIDLRPANVARKAGATKILHMLGDKKQGVEPSLKISEKCSLLIECLPLMMHNPKDPEDVLKVDIDEQGRGGDDPYDGARYGVMVKTSVGISF